MKNIRNFNVTYKNVLVRCDLNVPLDAGGNILDDFKIRQAFPTIKYLIDNKAKIILISHLGDPQGNIVPELRMDRVAEKLSKYLNIYVATENDCVGPEIEGRTNALQEGSVLLLENLRFHKEESEGDLKFAEELSWMCEIYINDAFGECHKISASITGVPQYLPSGMGLLLEKEISSLNKILQNPERPLSIIVGGKADTEKLKFIDSISSSADWVLVSGLIKEELIKRGMLLKYRDKIVAPVGFSDSFDIDRKTIKAFQEKIFQSKTILWYGPLGKLEERRYSKGTSAIAKAIIKSKAFSVVGGSEAVEFLIKKGLAEKFSHVSNGGHAILQYLSGVALPGLVALR